MRSSDGSEKVGNSRTPQNGKKVPDHDAMRAFFSGKRKTDRKAVRHKVEVHGKGNRVVGRTVDVSEGGVLVRIMDEASGTPQPRSSMLATMKSLEAHFQTGVVLGFPALAIRIPVTPIRLSDPPSDDEGFLLGFKFDRALEPEEAAKLLPPTSAPVGPLPFVPKPGVTFDALAFAEGLASTEPVLCGRVVGMDGSMLDVRATDPAAAASPEAAASLVRDRQVRLQVIEGDVTVWTGPVHLLAASKAPGAAGGVELRFETAESFPVPFALRFAPRR